MILSIAWKNIWRSKTRSLVVIIAIGLGLWGGIFSSALMNGMALQKISSVIKNEVSHIQIHHPKYLENTEIKYFIPREKEIIEQIKKIENIKYVAPRIKLEAMVSTSKGASGAKVLGINPEIEKEFMGIKDAILDSASFFTNRKITDKKQIAKILKDSCGVYLSANKKNKIIIGEKLAKKLKAKIRNRVIIQFQSQSGEMVRAAFKIVGIFRTNNSAFDEMTVFVRKKDLQRLTKIPENSVHEIVINLENNDKINKTLSQLKSKFPDYKVRMWKEILPELALISDSTTIMLYVFIIIILLALGFGIVNTMLMVILERTKELGMLMAIGMNRKRVFYMIMTETVLLCFTGAFLGFILSFITVEYFSTTGIDLSSFAEGLEAMGYDSIVYTTLDLKFYLGVLVLVFLTGVFAAIYPALKALKLKPAEAIRTE